MIWGSWGWWNYGVRRLRAGGATGRCEKTKPLPLDPTFEADPIGRRLECLPKKEININFILFLMVFLMGPRGN